MRLNNLLSVSPRALPLGFTLRARLFVLALVLVPFAVGCGDDDDTQGDDTAAATAGQTDSPTTGETAGDTSSGTTTGGATETSGDTTGETGGDTAGETTGTDTATDAGETADTGDTGDTGPFTWPDENLTAYVNPFIGTGGDGFGVGTTSPGATRPFGMVKLAPDTGTATGQLQFQNCTGYFYTNPFVWGFSHSRFSGMGVPDYGAVSVMPVRGLKEDVRLPYGARSKFSHDDEEASVGYYRVKLTDADTMAELTAATHAGFHRYTFPKGAADAYITTNLSYTIGKEETVGSQVTIDPATQTIKGYTTVSSGYTGRQGGIRTYFVAKYSAPFAEYGVWDEARTMASGTAQTTTPEESKEAGAWVRLDVSGSGAVDVRVGLSYISVEQAQTNLDLEIGTKSFETIREETVAAWQAVLGRVRIKADDSAEGAAARERFYTALYRAFQHPTDWTEPKAGGGGHYLGFDRKVHDVEEGFIYYTDHSSWDTTRTVHPLFNLIAREQQADMAQSLVKMTQQGGSFPRWPIAAGYSGGMTGDFGAITVVDTALKDIGGSFDADTAYDLLLKYMEGKQTTDGRSDVDHYRETGWVRADVAGNAASNTLEQAYGDKSFANMARKLGKSEDAAVYDAFATNYKNVWNSEYGFFMGRRGDGSWVTEKFDPTVWNDVYVEGNAWQFLWFVPHDAAGQAALMGGVGAYKTKLDEFFNLSRDYDKNNPYGRFKPFPYYWHSNEPDLHATLLYNEVGEYDAAQETARWALNNNYGNGPDGLPGNDDGGTMSAWYVEVASGFYALPGTDTYWLASPIFERIEFDMSDATDPASAGRKLTITTKNFTPGAVKADVKVNGETRQGAFTWQDIKSGGVIEYSFR
jgi:predicted alpha-1,2-mannosidase